MTLLCCIAEAILLVLFGPSDVFVVFWICLHIEIAHGGYYLIRNFTMKLVLLLLGTSYTLCETPQAMTEKNHERMLGIDARIVQA